ncbi:MAG TPA: K(+)-transporting ATPase subunit F [Pirellulales bacterium]
MSWIHTFAAVIAAGLFAYLTAALLWPEKFS